MPATFGIGLITTHVISTAVTINSVESACPLSYTLHYSSGAAYSGTFITLTAGNLELNINKDVLGSETVFWRATYPQGFTGTQTATTDSPDFTISVTCSAVTLSAVTTPNDYIVRSTTPADIAVIDLSSLVSGSTSHATTCPLTYDLREGAASYVATGSSLLSFASPTVSVRETQLGSVTVFARISNPSSTVDSNSFSVSMACSTISTTLVPGPYAYTVRSTAPVDFEVTDASTHSSQTSHISTCSITYVLIN